MLAEYSHSGVTQRRIDHVATVDSRPSSGNLAVRWSGRLFIQYADRFDIRPYGCGELTITLNGKEIISATRSDVGWFDTKSMELDYGWHPIEITYRAANDKRFGIYWSCNRFLTEPITSWFHLPADESIASGEWENGLRYVREMGCTHCHEVPRTTSPVGVPPLDKLAGNVHQDWLVRFLENNGHGAPNRAPDLHFSSTQVSAVVSGLPKRMPTPHRTHLPQTKRGQPHAHRPHHADLAPAATGLPALAGAFCYVV